MDARNGIRKGDTIIAVNGRPYNVEHHAYNTISAVPREKPRNPRRFDPANLECMDWDDGVWQEMVPRRRLV